MPDWTAKVQNSDGAMTKWIEYAKNLSKRHVTFIVDPKSPDRIADAISHTPFSSLQGNDNEKYAAASYESRSVARGWPAHTSAPAPSGAMTAAG